MKEAAIEKGGAFDPDLFSPEELEMMGDARSDFDGSDLDAGEIRQDAAELQRQYRELAGMVAEGAERERQLRALVNELTLLAKANDHQRSYHEQTQHLAKLVLASSERELHLQQCLEAVRNVALARVRNIT